MNENAHIIILLLLRYVSGCTIVVYYDLDLDIDLGMP